MMNRTLIIAEAGVNHNGSLKRAFEMVDVAAQSGVDYIKFQTFKAELLVNRYAPTAQYQKANLKENATDSQLDMLRKLELSFNDFIELAQYCREKGVGFLSTPFDFESIGFLASMKLDYMKIPSGEITNLPYLRAIAATKIPVIMSTGMSTVDEVKDAVNVLRTNGLTDSDITLLHCNTEYPTPFSDVNLLAMTSLKNATGLAVGYSDHTLGIEVPVAAVALGATVIEKHFTLDRSLPGPDHAASLVPEELTAMVSSIRHIESALGCQEKFVTDSERKNITVARKSIVAARPIKKGELLTAANITVKRPGNGLSPMLWDSVIGTLASRDFEPDQLITLS